MILGVVCLGCHYKIPQIGCLNKQKFISHSAGGQKAQDRELGDLVPSERSLPGPQTTAFLLCPYRQREREGEGEKEREGERERKKKRAGGLALWCLFL